MSANYFSHLYNPSPPCISSTLPGEKLHLRQHPFPPSLVIIYVGMREKKIHMEDSYWTHKMRIQTQNLYDLFPSTNSYQLATQYLDYKIAHNLSFYGSPWQGGKKREVMLKTKTGIIIRDWSGLIRKTSIKQREIFHQFYIHSNLNMNAHFHSLKLKAFKTF